MRPAWRKHFDVRTPRYTSYPSALHFDQAVTGADLSEKLSEVGLYAPLSIYVHAPFRRPLRWDCGCAMQVESVYARAGPYIDALVAEIALHAAALGGRGRPASVHVGGGAPNYFTVDDIARVVAAIEAQLGLTDSAHLAIELDPRQVRAGDLGRLATMGFDRFCLGVQDFDPGVQAAIDRVQPFDLVESCVSDIRAAGVDDLSFDILYGLPRQSLATFAQTLEKVVALGPDRVSACGDAHLPSAFARERLIRPGDLPDGEARADMAALADARLTAAGYRRVGFDHYARPGNALARAAAEGRLKRNFQGFADDPSPTILGVGASAISFVDGLYAQNEKEPAAYARHVAAGRSPVVRGHQRTRRETIIGEAIASLLCEMSADAGPVLRSAPPAEALRICAALDGMEADGVISWRGDRIVMAAEAFFLARAVAAVLDPHTIPAGATALAV